MKHVCIIGGGASLAQCLIKHCLEQGHRVTAVCRDQLPTATSVGLPTLNTPDLTMLHSVNMANSKHCEQLRTLPKVDTLITLTGSVANNRLREMVDDDWFTVLESNLTCVFNAFRYLLPNINRNGNVVVVGSIVGSTGGQGCANYAASKAGLVGLVRAAANEYTSRDLCINLLELGYVNKGMGERLTPMLQHKIAHTIPLGRFGTEEDFVLAVDFLANTRYMTGNVLTLAGGLR